MINPHDFRGLNGVLNTGMILVTCGYIAVGFFGYLKYGDAVHGSITLNLPPSDKYVAALCCDFFSYLDNVGFLWEFTS